MKIFKTKLETENDAYLMLDLWSDKNGYGWVDNCVEVTFDQSGCILAYFLENMTVVKKFARYEDTEIHHAGYEPDLGLPQNSETI